MLMRSLRHLLPRFAAAAAVTVSGASPAAADDTAASRSDDDADVGLDLDLGRAELAGQALAYTLSDLPPIEATHTACTYALSNDRGRRIAVASALEWAFHLVGDDVVIDHLASDPDARVRRAAARAAWARRAIGGDAGVLDRLAHDPDPGVREVAALAAPDR